MEDGTNGSLGLSPLLPQPDRCWTCRCLRPRRARRAASVALPIERARRCESWTLGRLTFPATRVLTNQFKSAPPREHPFNHDHKHSQGLLTHWTTRYSRIYKAAIKVYTGSAVTGAETPTRAEHVDPERPSSNSLTFGEDGLTQYITEPAVCIWLLLHYTIMSPSDASRSSIKLARRNADLTRCLCSSTSKLQYQLSDHGRSIPVNCRLAFMDSSPRWVALSLSTESGPERRPSSSRSGCVCLVFQRDARRAFLISAAPAADARAVSGAFPSRD